MTNRSACVRVSVDVCDGWSHRRRREIQREVRALIEWELPQHLSEHDRAVVSTSGDVFVHLHGGTASDAERLARRLRKVFAASTLGDGAHASALVTIDRVEPTAARNQTIHDEVLDEVRSVCSSATSTVGSVLRSVAVNVRWF